MWLMTKGNRFHEDFFFLICSTKLETKPLKPLLSVPVLPIVTVPPQLYYVSQQLLFNIYCTQKQFNFPLFKMKPPARVSTMHTKNLTLSWPTRLNLEIKVSFWPFTSLQGTEKKNCSFR